MKHRVSHDTEIDEDLKDLIDKLLIKNPIDRITIKEIMVSFFCLYMYNLSYSLTHFIT